MEKKEKMENEQNKIIKKSKKESKKISFSKVEIFSFFIITMIISFIAGLSIKKNDKSVELGRYENELLENYRYIIKNYYQDIDSRELVSSAVKGMIGYLNINDPYANYIDAENIDEFDIEIEGNYQGIGIQISYTESKEIIIQKVFENSPAKKAGIEAGDIIIAINNEETNGITLEELKQKVKKAGNEDFKIKVRREEKELEYTVKSEMVELETVSSKIIDEESKIGYIKLDSFANKSYESFKTQLETLEEGKISSLIIDLRNNSGGKLTTAVDIVSMFLDKSNVIYQFKEKEKIVKYYSLTNEKREYPIVILVNGNTASAAELMTAALKEKYNAYVIGTKTYGKGTAQKIVSLENGEKFKITVNEWLTAEGNAINKEGITPNKEIENDEEYYKNPSEENDAQLKTAIEYLKEK